MQVLDCHDAVVYCLAPLQYALISACTDCVVVLGAVGRALRVERCERVQVRPPAGLWVEVGVGVGVRVEVQGRRPCVTLSRMHCCCPTPP